MGSGVTFQLALTEEVMAARTLPFCKLYQTAAVEVLTERSSMNVAYMSLHGHVGVCLLFALLVRAFISRDRTFCDLPLERGCERQVECLRQGLVPVLPRNRDAGLGTEAAVAAVTVQ